MAVTEFGTNAAQTRKVWAKLTMREAIYKTWMKKFMGESEDSVIQVVPDLEEGAGDEVKYDLLVQMSGYGVGGDNPIKGFEEALTYYQDSVKIDQRRLAHAFRRMSQQRTVHDLRKDGRRNLSERWATILDELLFGQLAGSFDASTSAPADFQAHGGNALVSPTSDTDHYKNDQANTLTTNMLEGLVEKAKTIEPLVRPCKIDGMDVYVYVAHPYSITDLRTNTSSNQWIEVTKFANMGSVKNNPFFTGAVGMWANVVIYDSTRIPILNPGASQYARNLLLGAQAGVVAFGNAYAKFERESMGDDNMMSWWEEVDDYGNARGVATGAIFGVKPCIFNSKRFGCIVHETKAVAH